jgi:hypothetical protein
VRKKALFLPVRALGRENRRKRKGKKSLKPEKRHFAGKAMKRAED